MRKNTKALRRSAHAVPTRPASQRTFTVTISQQAADSLANFCEEFRRVTPEALIVDATEGYLDSCDNPIVGFRYDASQFAAIVARRLEHEARIAGGRTRSTVLVLDAELAEKAMAYFPTTRDGSLSAFVERRTREEFAKMEEEKAGIAARASRNRKGGAK